MVLDSGRIARTFMLVMGERAMGETGGGLRLAETGTAPRGAGFPDGGGSAAEDVRRGIDRLRRRAKLLDEAERRAERAVAAQEAAARSRGEHLRLVRDGGGGSAGRGAAVRLLTGVVLGAGIGLVLIGLVGGV